MFLASSCNNDDDDDPIVTNPTIDKNLLIGSWEMKKVVNIEYLNGQMTSNDTIIAVPGDQAEYDIYTFSSDGHFTSQSYGEIGTYTVSGSGSAITVNSLECPQALIVKTLTQDKLTLYGEKSYSDPESGETYKLESTMFMEKLLTIPLKIAKK